MKEKKRNECRIVCQKHIRGDKIFSLKKSVLEWVIMSSTKIDKKSILKEIFQVALNKFEHDFA